MFPHAVLRSDAYFSGHPIRKSDMGEGVIKPNVDACRRGEVSQIKLFADVFGV